MHVREFQKPGPILVKMRRQVAEAGRLKIVDDEVEFRYEDYIAEYVWSHGEWNTDESWGEAQIRIGEAIEATPVGCYVRFAELDDFEKFRKANNAAQITGPNAHRIRRFQKAGKNARAPVPVAAAAE